LQLSQESLVEAKYQEVLSICNESWQLQITLIQ